MKPTELTGVVAEHVSAVNALDTDAIMATFAEDAYVNDARREFVGTEAIRRWVAREMVGDKVSIDVREVLDHRGDHRPRRLRRHVRPDQEPARRDRAPRTTSASATARSSASS